MDYFTINPDEWRMADLGVFVTDATKEVEKLNAARELVQAFMQNGGQFSMALETLESDNFVELKQKIQQAEQAMMELQQAQSEAQSQGLQEQRQFEVQKHSDEMMSKERDRQVEQEEGERDRQNQIILKNMELNKPAPQPMADPREQGLKERQQSETERSNRAKEGLEEKKINASKQKNSDR